MHYISQQRQYGSEIHSKKQRNKRHYYKACQGLDSDLANLLKRSSSVKHKLKTRIYGI